jgi:hypothetical protein
MKEIIRKILKETEEELDNSNLIDLPKHTEPSKGVVAPSQKVISDVCEKEQFCKKQGPITFGQLRTLVETAQNKNLTYDIGEGVYKALIRLIPWFFPQIAVAGFVGSSIRAFNKIIKPGLEDTRGYKKWWGRTLIHVMDAVEGDIPHEDPISKIFFISDGLLHMMDRKFKIKFARYISELAASKPDSEPVPEYFVENELRNWINQKFLLSPPLEPKTMNESKELDDIDWMRGDIETPLKDFKDLGYELTDVLGFNVRISENSRFYNADDEDNPIEEVGIINDVYTTFGDSLPIQVKWIGRTNSYRWEDLIVVSQGNKLNESEEDDWGWAKEIEVKTDLTPAQIYNRYQTFPIEIVGPYIAGQFIDIEYRSGKLYFIAGDWCDLIRLFEDNDGGYSYMNRYLAKAVFCDEDYWEPYSASDLIGREWKSNVWDLVTDDQKALEYIKKYIRKGGFIDGELENGEPFREDMLLDDDLMGDLINEDEMFDDLKMELGWAYASSYNNAVSSGIYTTAVDSIKDLLGQPIWENNNLVFESTDLILDVIKNKISGCWDSCKKYYDPERHYDTTEHADEIEAFESFCEECIDEPFGHWSYFNDFYADVLDEENEDLSPHYSDYATNSDMKEYFLEDLYSRI